MYLTLLSCLIIALFFFIYNNPKLLSIRVLPLLAPFILQCPLEGPHSKWDPVMVLIGMLFNTNTPWIYKSPETRLSIDYSYQYYAEITNQATQRGLADCVSATFIIMRQGFFRSLLISLFFFLFNNSVSVWNESLVTMATNRKRLPGIYHIYWVQSECIYRPIEISVLCGTLTLNTNLCTCKSKKLWLINLSLIKSQK